MSDDVFIKKMVESVGEVPSEVDVYAVRQYALDEIGQRAERFLTTVAESFSLPQDRGDRMIQEDRTVIRLPLGARAVVYHASGAMQIVSGLQPMEALFSQMDDQESLIRLVEKTVDRLNLGEWIGKEASLSFEHLWQIKAAAADREGITVKPVLCRIIGAYRHYVGKFPVWGAASMAVKLAGEGQLDSVTLQVRETTGEVLDRASVLEPERAAHQVLQQLKSLMGRSKIPASEMARPQWFSFGYVSLSKRKPQRLLAPVYTAAVEIVGQEEAQAYLFVVPATEKAYLPLERMGSDAPPAPVQRIRDRMLAV